MTKKFMRRQVRKSKKFSARCEAYFSLLHISLDAAIADKIFHNFTQFKQRKMMKSCKIVLSGFEEFTEPLNFYIIKLLLLFTKEDKTRNCLFPVLNEKHLIATFSRYSNQLFNETSSFYNH